MSQTFLRLRMHNTSTPEGSYNSGISSGTASVSQEQECEFVMGTHSCCSSSSSRFDVLCKVIMMVSYYVIF